MAETRETGSRFAILLPSFEGGGAERVGLYLIEDWLRAGYEVDLVLVRAHGSLLTLLPPQVRVIDLKADRLRSALAPLVRYLRTTRPQAVQASMWPVTILAIIARSIARSPARVIVSEHSTLSRQYARWGRLHAFLLRASLRFFYPRADARVAVSREAADDLARLGGLDRESITAIYNPVPEVTAAKIPPEVEEQWHTSQGRILSVGRMSPEKNHALLLRAFAIVRRQRPAKLALVGDGPLREDLQRLASELGLADDVLFTGFVLDPQPYYASAQIFVLPSDFEGYPLVLVEALASGLAIVSTDCLCGPREILADGDYGSLVPCGDADAMAKAMLAALTEPPHRPRLVERGKALSGTEAFGSYRALMLGEKVEK
jgi:glycosyltransferase involved in cell wall biosynthesis